MSQDPLTQILKNALSGNDILRKEAESQITKLASDNLSQFLINISSKISNENEEKAVRQISALLIKNLILKNEYKNTFLNLNTEEKSLIKNHVLSSLASSDIDIRKAASNAIASICKIEIPNHQWLDIFDILINTSQNENLFIQISSVTTLSFIFTEISVNDIPQNTVIKLLNSFYTILKKDNINLELHIFTLQAILNFIPYIHSIIKADSQNINFFELIKSSLMNGNDKVRNNALHIFMELIRLYYDNFQNFIDQLFEVTKEIIVKDNQENAILSYELWCTIADIEINRIKNKSNNLNFCNRFYPQLLPILLNHLKTDDYDNDEWDLRKASSALISLLSQCCDYPFIENILKFISDNINNDNNDNKNISLLAFGSILDTNYHDKLLNNVKQSLQMISNFLIDNNTPNHLKEISSWCINKICENYGEDFVEDKENFDKIIWLILSLLPNSQNKICVYLCNALNSIIQKVNSDINEKTNILSPYVQKMMDILLNLASRKTSYDIENNVSLCCFYTMGTLVEHCAKDVNNIIITNCKILSEMYEKTLDDKIFTSYNMRIDFQSYILSTLYSFILSDTIPFEHIRIIYLNIINSFQQRKSIFEEGITAIIAIASVLENKFIDFMDDFINYLIVGLKSINEFYLCKYSIHCTSVIIRSLRDLFSKYINQILPLIMNILSSNDVDRNLTLDAFNIISDLFYSCSKETFNYFDSIMNVLGTSLQSSMINNISDDNEIIKYFQKFREHLLENLTCIFSAVIDINKEKEFIVYVKPIIEFMNRICVDEKCVNLEILKSCLGLYGDFCKYYGVQIKSYINSEIISKIIQYLSRPENYNTDDNIGKLINYSKKMIEQVLNS